MKLSAAQRHILKLSVEMKEQQQTILPEGDPRRSQIQSYLNGMRETLELIGIRLPKNKREE